MVWAGRMQFEYFAEGSAPDQGDGPGEAFHVTPACATG